MKGLRNALICGRTPALMAVALLGTASMAQAEGFECKFKSEHGSKRMTVSFAKASQDVVPGKLNLTANSRGFKPMIGASNRNYRNPTVLIVTFSQAKPAVKGPHSMTLELAPNESARISLRGEKIDGCAKHLGRGLSGNEGADQSVGQIKYEKDARKDAMRNGELPHDVSKNELRGDCGCDERDRDRTGNSRVRYAVHLSNDTGMHGTGRLRLN